jgi:hypothetical protein
MDLNRRQKLDMIEGLVLYNGGKYSLLNNKFPAYKMPNDTWVKLDYIDPFVVESDIGFSYNDVPSNKALLGGIARVKDYRRALSVIKLALSQIDRMPLNTYQISQMVSDALIEDGMEFNGFDDLPHTLESVLTKHDLSPRKSIDAFGMIGVEYYWPEHHSRSNGRAPTDTIYDMTSGVPLLRDTSRMEIAVEHFLKSSPHSFEKFVINFHRFCCSKNLSVSIIEQPGDPETLPLDVENAMRNAYETFSQTGNSDPLIGLSKGLIYRHKALGSVRKTPRAQNIELMRGILSQNVKPKISPRESSINSSSKLELISKMAVRSELLKWQDAVFKLSEISQSKQSKDQLMKSWKEILPNELPSLGSINVSNTRRDIEQVECEFKDILTLSSVALLLKTRRSAVSLFEENTLEKEYVYVIISEIQDSFDKASVPDKLFIAIDAETLLSSNNVVTLKQSIADGVYDVHENVVGDKNDVIKPEGFVEPYNVSPTFTSNTGFN